MLQKKHMGLYKLKYLIPQCRLTQHVSRREEMVSGGRVRLEMSLEVLIIYALEEMEGLVIWGGQRGLIEIE